MFHLGLRSLGTGNRFKKQLMNMSVPAPDGLCLVMIVRNEIPPAFVEWADR